MDQMKNILFLGATTIDIHYLVNNFPPSNAKVKAGDFAVTVGGPATNAAITNAYLGGASELWSVVGKNPFHEFINMELKQFRITHMDLATDEDTFPGISSIITTEKTGDRSVVYKTADYRSLHKDYIKLFEERKFDLVLSDGLLMEASIEIAKLAVSYDIPFVLDAGSWKDRTEKLLRYTDIVICSDDFLPPGIRKQKEVFGFLTDHGIERSAITRGGRSILYRDGKNTGDINVREVKAVDTLGAGDILHGAFCHYYADSHDFVHALLKASDLATYTTQFFGTKSWMSIYRT
jgi:sugar/nucleoside kinase (ribokinase family)